MEKIIKEKIAFLELRNKKLFEMFKTEHVSQSFIEFYKRQAETTKDQILLLQEILEIKEKQQK